MAAFRKLKRRYVLRGWQRLPFAVQDTETGNTAFLDEVAFQAASFCNGQIDVDGPLLLPAHKEAIAKLQEHGIVEECRFGEALDPEQLYRLAPCRFIRRAHWSITGKCNLRCRHCYMDAPHGRYGEPTHEQCMTIVQQLSDANIGQISLTGGEPLIRRDFFDVVDALLDRKITISQIYTNGVLVNDKLLSRLEDRGIRSEFSLSFDGIGYHDWLRGVSGAEKNAVDAIRLLRLRGFEVGIESTFHRDSLHTLPATLDLLAELGVRSWKTNPASGSGNWLNEGGHYDVTIGELYDAYLDLIPKFRAAGAPLSIMLGGFFTCGKGSERYRIPCKKFDGSEKMLRQTVCQSARTTMYIGPDGRLYPCMPLTGLSLPNEMPVVAEGGLCAALTDSSYLALIDTRLADLLRANERCAACAHKLYCGGGCRAGALICGAGYLGPDDYSCYFFQHDYEQRIAAIYGTPAPSQSPDFMGGQFLGHMDAALHAKWSTNFRH